MTSVLQELPPQATAPSAGSRGAVFTRRWVVDFVLDAAGYEPSSDLASKVAIEPACGNGAFLQSMVERLVKSCHQLGRTVDSCTDSIRAYDLDAGAVEASRALVERTLVTAGVPPDQAKRLANGWVHQADFLLLEARPVADFVVGNPPYVRIEDVDTARLKLYRDRWRTMSGRADVYVGFIESGLRWLRQEGVLTYICADRWMRNQYGAALRHMVETDYSVDASIVFHDVDAFEERVSAYPAVVRLRRGDQGPAVVGEAAEEFDPETSTRVAGLVRSGEVEPVSGVNLARLGGWFTGGESWPTGSPERIRLISALQRRLPLLEETGAKVRVGVATGADDVFVVPSGVDIEPDRLLPAIAARELSGDSINWTGSHLVNPWNGRGLVDLDEYRLMGSYLRSHAVRLRSRHVARHHPDAWWRTIDRVDETMTNEAKLLIPDLKDRIEPTLDTGRYYPLHNLYYVISPTWDLRVLGGLLLSDVAGMFVEAYSVRMANGYMRVSAQYLRRIRVPMPDEVDVRTAGRLAKAFEERDRSAATSASLDLYGISDLPS